MKTSITERWCSQCKRMLATSSFLWGDKRLSSGWRVTKCNACAQGNMRRWARTSLSNFDPDRVGRSDE